MKDVGVYFFRLEMAYGQWGNLAGYIYGTAVLYSLNPPDTRTPQEINRKIEEEKQKQMDNEEQDEDTATERKTDAEVDAGDKDEEDEEDKPNDSAD